MFTDGYIVNGRHNDQNPQGGPNGPTCGGMAYDVKKVTVKVGDVVIVPPGVVHGWADIPDHVDYLSFRPSQGVMQAGWGSRVVDACGLGLGDPFELALAPQVRFELGEYAEHVEEALAGGRAGIDRLLGRLGRLPGCGLCERYPASPMLRARRLMRVPSAPRQPEGIPGRFARQAIASKKGSSSIIIRFRA